MRYTAPVLVGLVLLLGQGTLLPDSALAEEQYDLDESAAQFEHRVALELAESQQLDVFTRDTCALINAYHDDNPEAMLALIDKHTVPGSPECLDSFPVDSACRHGAINCLRALIARGADVNTTAPYRALTPLMLAADSGSAEMLSLLLESGAEVNQLSEDGNTALHFAAEFGSVEACRLLLLHGAKVSVADDHWLTPLHLAAEHSFTDVMQLLLNSGANPNAGQGIASTPLHKAAGAGQLEAIELLLANGADVGALDSAGETPLRLAARADRIEAVELLLNHKAPAEDAFIAVTLGQADRLAQMLRSDSSLLDELDSEGRSLYEWALVHDEPECARTLALARGVTARTPPVLLAMAQTALKLHPGDSTLPGMLLDQISSGQLRDSGADLLAEAAALDSPLLVAMLLERGVPVDSVGSNNVSAAALAASSSSANALTVLLLNGADARQSTASGNGLIHLALQSGQGSYYQADEAARCIAALVLAGADINATDSAGRTALDCLLDSISESAVDASSLEQAEQFRLVEVLRSFGALRAPHGE